MSQQTLICWPNTGLMLGQRRRRWINIKPALCQRIVFAGYRGPRVAIHNHLAHDIMDIDHDLPNDVHIRDAPFDIWGGGGGRVFVACKLFFLPPRKNNLFFGDQCLATIFFYVSTKKFFVVCFPYYHDYVRYHLVFFLVNIFFINFDNKLFFCPHFQQTFFF